MAVAASSAKRNIKVEILGTPRDISPQVDLSLFRAAQETINNANKHSKSASVLLILDYSDPEFIMLESSDDGVGTDELSQGFGLIGIQERVRLLNGTTQIVTSAGKGFKIKITIPSQNEH